MNATNALRRSTPALLAVLLLVACGSPAPAEQMQVDDARARMSPRMAGVAAAYLDLTNETGVDDRLVSVTVDPQVAGRVEIHETFEVDDSAAPGRGGGAMHGDREMPGAGHGAGAGGDAPMMGMREISHVDLPAGARVELVPGGLHLMLMELVTDLFPGDTFELTLVFEHAEPVTVEVEVREQA